MGIKANSQDFVRNRKILKVTQLRTYMVHYVLNYDHIYVLYALSIIIRFSLQWVFFLKNSCGRKRSKANLKDYVVYTNADKKDLFLESPPQVHDGSTLTYHRLVNKITNTSSFVRILLQEDGEKHYKAKDNI